MKSKFKLILKSELKKAIWNKFFLISLICGLCFTLMSGLYCIEDYRMIRRNLTELGGNTMVQAFGLFNTWIGGESSSLGFTFFYTLLPILAILPYGWSFCMEKKSGYLKVISIRTGRLQYMGAKYIAVFFAGGMAIVLPLVFNLLFVACFVPAVCPTIIYSIYYPMHYGAIWSEIFFSSPIIFTILYLIMDFIFAGLFAVMSFACSFFTSNRIAVILTPYFLILSLHYCRTLLHNKVYKEISPLNFLHATSIENVADGGIILIEAVILFALTCGIVIWKGRKYEDL